MEGQPKFTYDFVMGQLRMTLVAGLAFAGGKGWLTPTDAGALLAIATAAGPLAVPWVWSIITNLGKVHVGSGSAAAEVAKVEAISPATAVNAAAVVSNALGKAAGLLLAAILLASIIPASPASAQTGTRRATQATPAQPKQTNGLPCDPANLLPGCKTAQAEIDGRSPTDALPCMDISMLTKLTLQNLMPTTVACIQKANNKLVTDTQRALDSAKAFKNSASGTAGAAVGDNDAINCLTPALALFQAAMIIPAVPAQDAVLNADGTVKTPAVAAVDAIEPGPILLGQKFREFVELGGLTTCKNVVNYSVQAVAAAGAGDLATAATGAALIAPK